MYAGSIPTPASIPKGLRDAVSPSRRGPCARMVKLVDTWDLKSLGPKGPWRFESASGHQPRFKKPQTRRSAGEEPESLLPHRALEERDDGIHKVFERAAGRRPDEDFSRHSRLKV